MKNYRADFPMLARRYQDKDLVYFDNAATALKPQAVLGALNDYYLHHNANIHRGPNFLAEEATLLYEEARQRVAGFIGADTEEIVFTAGTTAGVNLVARSWGEKNLQPGDVVALTRAEHHANIVPWLQLQASRQIKLQYIEVKEDGAFEPESLAAALACPRLRLLAITQASNVLGQFYELESILAAAKARGVLTLVDAAQSVVHHQINVRQLDCDFLVFSGHKLFAPSGSGVLYIRAAVLAAMPPFLGGGGIITEVKADSFSTVTGPTKFEAGTPNIEGAIALGAACHYLQEIGQAEIFRREQELSNYFLEKLAHFPWIRLLGGTENRLPLFSLVISGLHPHDAADLLGEQGIVTRAGHHCAQPLHDALGVIASLRASLAFYNTEAEIDYFFVSLDSLRQSFQN